MRCVFLNTVDPAVDDADTSLLLSSVFGFTQEDWRTLCGILVSAKPNVNPNEFPDFRSGDSILEHFEITATVESRKGSEFKRNHEPFAKSMHMELSKTVTDEAQVVHRAFTYPNRQHELLLKSLERNLSKHIDALRTYAAEYAPGSVIFVIEHQEYGVFMFENVFEKIGEGRVFGDMRPPQKFDNYRMSRDRAALELLAKHEDELDVVVFVGTEYIEFIKVNEISYMIQLMPWPFVVVAGPAVEQHTFVPILQARLSEKEQDDYEQD